MSYSGSRLTPDALYVLEMSANDVSDALDAVAHPRTLPH